MTIFMMYSSMSDKDKAELCCETPAGANRREDDPAARFARPFTFDGV
jgi:hypothetical protein